MRGSVGNEPRILFAGILLVSLIPPTVLTCRRSGLLRRVPAAPNAGVGHVFESNDGGATWTDISGGLPDAPADDLVIAGGYLYLAMDVGMFRASAATPTAWSHLGTGLPNAAVNDLSLSPNASYLIAATHGRGIWKYTLP